MTEENKNSTSKKTLCESKEVFFGASEVEEHKQIQKLNSVVDIEMVNPALISIASNLKFLKSLDVPKDVMEAQKNKIIKLFELELDNQITEEENIKNKNNIIIKLHQDIISHISNITEKEDRTKNFSDLVKSLWVIHLIVNQNINKLRQKERDKLNITKIGYTSIGEKLKILRNKKELSASQEREINLLKDEFSIAILNHLNTNNDWSILNLNKETDTFE